MARRRRRESGFEASIDVASRLPPWLALMLAAVTYAGFHALASIQIESPKGLGALGPGIGLQMIKAAGLYLQYLVPAVLLIGAVVSWFRALHRKGLLADTAARGGQAALLDLTWKEFEQLVGELFRRRGYSVAETGATSSDGGIDLVLRKGGEKALVQCKQWRATRVGVEVVRELFGAMAAAGATSGFVVASGRFTDDARAFAAGRNLFLVDGEELRKALAAAKRLTENPAPPAAVSSPNCPKCGREMVNRVARQGSNAGAPFWGCVGYPTCRGTRPLS